MDNIKHERDISPMQGAYHSKTIQNNKIQYNTKQYNIKHNYLLSSMTWTVTH